MPPSSVLCDCAVVVGHSLTDEGACSADGSVREWSWNRPMADVIVEALRAKGRTAVLVLRDEGVGGYAFLPRKVNATKARCAIELHLNAFNRIASGTEALYWKGSVKGTLLATALQKAMVGVLSLPDRGTKGIDSDDRGGNLLRQTTMPTVIVEPFFIDNPSDLARGTPLRTILGLALAQAVDQYLQTQT